MAVCLDGGDGRARLGQRQCERAQPRPHFDDAVTGPYPRQPGDAPHGVGVNDEVLAEGAAGSKVVARQEVEDLAAGEGHALWATS